MKQPSPSSNPGLRGLNYAEPATEQPGFTIEWLARPIGWRLHVAAVLLVATAMYADSGPVPYNRPSLLAGLGCLAVASV